MTGPQQPSNIPANLNQRLDLDFALQAAGLGVWEYNPQTGLVDWDQRCQALYGISAANDIAYQQAMLHIHPDDADRVDAAVQRAIDPQSDGSYDETYRTMGVDDGRLRWVRFQGRAYFTPTGTFYRFAGIAQEVTRQVLAQQEIGQAHQQILTALEHLPVGLGIAVLEGEDLIFRSVNAYYCQLVAQSSQDLVGMPLLKARPEVENQGVVEWLKEVMATGRDWTGLEVPGKILRNNELEGVYNNFVYTPQYRPDGTISGVIVILLNVTAQVKSRQAIEQSQQRILKQFDESPVGIATISREALTFHSANPFYGQLVGRSPQQLIGKPLLVALPELAGQGFDTLLEQVIATNTSYTAPEVAVDLLREDQLETIYVNMTYQPQLSLDGQVTGVLVVATDVTKQVVSRQQLEESQDILRSIIDLAELGTYSIDLRSSRLHKSPRVANWYGLAEITDVASSLGVIEESDRERVNQAYTDALQSGSTGSYQFEYTIHNARSKQPYILQTVGQARRNAAGQFTHVDGLVRDITTQRAVQLALEQQVQARTQELNASNQELAAVNEELAATNEELTATNEDFIAVNTDLVRSNKNLEQFAYIASHDLQEPLRKIQQFGDLLKNQYGDGLGDGVAYLERMQTAASRMSVLIRDLLAFSRISTTQVIAQPVALNQVISRVLDTLSVVVEESGAQVEVTGLPVVPGDRSQLDQLFQNLLSNAVKFRRTSPTGELVTPQIRIKASLVDESELPSSVHPSRYAQTYHCIEVADNGIGFEAKYLERIFQVFQRLHGKNEYGGTGIGLAIVQKVVINHGGAITATSEPGQGATFLVYLPA